MKKNKERVNGFTITLNKLCNKRFIKFSFYKMAGIFILLVTNSTAKSQIITGNVKSQEGKQLDLVTITIKKDSSIIASTVTDSLGQYFFTESLPDISYNISFSRIGYWTFDTLLTIKSGLQLFILMKVNPRDLKEIIVTTKKPLIERKVDRLVFNVGSIINTAGLSTIDLLARAPLLQVKNDLPSIIGKESVGVMVNEKIIRLSGNALSEYLKAIPSETIAKIEIITNPPSNYDAEGVSGYINIITKSTKKLGYAGSLSPSFRVANGSSVNLSTSLNYNTQKIQFITSLSLGYGSLTSTYSNKISYPSFIWDENSTGKELSRVIFGTVGLEKTISKKTTLGLSYNQMFSKPDQIIKKQTSIINNIFQTDSTIIFPTNDYKTFINQSSNLHLNHNLDTAGKKIIVDFDWVNNSFDLKNDITKSTYVNGFLKQNSVFNNIILNNHDAEVYSINSEFVIPSSKANISFGSKLSFFINKNEVRFYDKINSILIIDSNKTDNFKVNENVQALFFNYDQSFKKIQIKLGIRGEFTQTKSISKLVNQINNNDYFNLFPTIYFSYSLNEKNDFSISYGKRLSRPSFSALNPFKSYFDYYSYSEGNPALKPYFSQNFELSHTYNNIYNSTIMFSSVKNGTYYLTTTDPITNVKLTKPGNNITSLYFLYDFSASLDISKRFSSSNEFSVFYTKVKTNLPDLLPTNKGWGGELKTINTWYMNKPKTLISEVVVVYQSSQISQFSNTKAQYYFDLAFKYNLPKKRLQINLAFRDIFKTKNYIQEQVVNGIRNYSTVNNSTRRVTFNMRYTFGNNKIKRANTHSSVGSDGGRIN